MSNLIPIEQKQIEFQDGTITAVMIQDENGRENVYIPLRPLVEGMGLSWPAQYRRIKKNPVLSEVCISVAVTATQVRQTLAIPISHLNGFLFGVNANRVKPELRPLIVEYQQKCYEVLFSAFNGTESMTRFYEAIGHEGGWIGARLEKHRYSTDLSDVWLINSIPIEHHERLSNIINKGAFGVLVDEHRQLKSLPDGADLRDNMTKAELLISAFGDEATMQFIENENAQGLEDHTKLAEAGGSVAGEMRELYENRTKAKVLSDKNHLDKKRLE